MRRTTVAVITLALVGMAPGVRAQVPSERAAMARALFHDGLTAAREERYETAADRFRRSHLLRPAPGTAYNLASALVHLRQLVEASELLEWVMRHEESSEALRAAASETVRAIQPRLARARILVDGPIDGIELQLDGVPLALSALLDVAVPMDPGPRRIVAYRGGAPVVEVPVELEEGAEQDIRLTIPSDPQSPNLSLRGGPERRPERAPEDLSWLLWTGVAVGVVAAAATTTAIVVDQSSSAPVPGTTFPPVLEWD